MHQSLHPSIFNFCCHRLSDFLHLYCSFGIFRLTDPPGLETILSCTVRNAFHPHPDLPIYTVSISFLNLALNVDGDTPLKQDADKGHVQMREMSLEISDIRTEQSLELWSRSGQKLQSNSNYFTTQ